MDILAISYNLILCQNTLTLRSSIYIFKFGEDCCMYSQLCMYVWRNNLVACLLLGYYITLNLGCL